MILILLQLQIQTRDAKSAIPSEKKEIWEDIRNKKQKGLKRLDVYEEYKEKYSLSGFNKVWYRL